MSSFQLKFNHANMFSRSWDISRQSFYSYWWPDILIVCCTYADSPYLGLSSTTYFVKIGLLVVEIQAKWSLWQYHLYAFALSYLSNRTKYLFEKLQNISESSSLGLPILMSWSHSLFFTFYTILSLEQYYNFINTNKTLGLLQYYLWKVAEY